MQIKKYTEPTKVWRVTNHDDSDMEKISNIAEKLSLDEVTAGIIYDRVGTDALESAEKFIGAEECFHDPFLLADIGDACERIEKALEHGRHIVVYGDYDVDGVTSVSVLVTYLKRRGAVDCSYYIPSRIGEGYGLSNATIDKVRALGADFMITVDTGITAVDEIEYAQSIGVETVVTDHHECKKDEDGNILLPSVPCVNPRRSDCTYPFDELAGVGVVFKLICALEIRRTGKSVEDVSRELTDEYGELVAIGTVADVMPLTDENRTIVKKGLELMRSPRFIGTRELINVAAGIDLEKKTYKKFTASLVSFTLAPRINAVGRMGNASAAVELFISEDREYASKKALELCEMNVVRQKEENKILVEALEKMNMSDSDDSVIVLDDDKWHHGVIGIVASRITERYGLPSILVSFDGNVGEKPSEDDIGKGSGRSVKGLDLVKALEACGDTLVRFGGHELAAGLTVKRGKLEEFKRAINMHAARIFDPSREEKELYADASVPLERLGVRLAHELYLLEPYGQANPVPVFMVEDLTIKELYPLKEGKHVKLLVSNGVVSTYALWFGKKCDEFEFVPGDKVDLLATLELNEYMGRTSVQLHIKDIRAGALMKRELERDADLYNTAMHGGAYPADMIPSRDDFASVYKYLRSSLKEDEKIKYSLIGAQAGNNGRIPYIKLRAVLDIMCELSLIEYVKESTENCQIRLNRQSGKVDLESSELLAALRRRAE